MNSNAKGFSELKSIQTLYNTDAYETQNIDEARLKNYLTHSTDLNFFYAYAPIDAKHLEVFSDIATETDVFGKYERLLLGNRVNTGENRAVLHHLLRGNVLNKKVIVDGEDKEQFYNDERDKVIEFATAVREHKILGSTGKIIKNVVQIGIGGSDLGPKAMSRAIYSYALKNKINIIEPYFISNVDPENAIYVMNKINPEETLFILVSKSGTTLETLQNYEIVKTLSEEKVSTKGFDFKKHLLAVTSKTSPLATSKDVLKAFFIDDYIGGRYSSTSAVGLLTLAISYGKDVILDFLKGARDGDKDAYVQKDIKENRTLLDALIGVYYLDALMLNSLAVLPYSEALHYFVAHLQQLDMESSGKQDDLNGNPFEEDDTVGPIIWGECGTNGQHSFYQYLHQGSTIVPLEFIAFKKNSAIDEKSKAASKLLDSHFKLNANVIAQQVAFAEGHIEVLPSVHHTHKDEDHLHLEDINIHKSFFGGRPLTLLFAPSLTPYTLGLLLSHFENKVMFQGFIWNINSFDQEGVQLGKKLANSIIDKSTNNKSLLTLEKLLS